MDEMPLPQSFLDELHARSDIVDVVSGYVALKKSSRLFTGLCPFHNEKTPSFTIYPDTQNFYCFGCQQGGDVISFIMKYENLDYIEAVRMLAARAGMPMPEETDDREAKRKKRILEANKLAARFFFEQLNTDAGREARGYLRSRGLADGTITKFGIGYAPAGWSALRDRLAGEGFSYEELVAAGLCAQKNNNVFDFFRNRVMFPVIDLQKHVVAFSGRCIPGSDDPRKYVNTVDTPVFKKSQVLFAMSFAKNNTDRRVILAEGQMDAISMHQAGFTEAVAALGTALTDEHVKLISRYADEVVLAYDSDEAGQKATKKALDKFRNTGLAVRVLSIPDAKDADEYIKKFGAARFSVLMEDSDNSVEYELRKAKNAEDLTTDAGKIRYLQAAAGILSRCRSATERDVYAGRVADELKTVNKSAILEEVDSAIKKSAWKKRRADDRAVVDNARKLALPSSLKLTPAAISAARALTAIAFKSPELLPKILEYCSEEDFPEGEYKTVFCAIREQAESAEYAGMSSLSGRLSDKEMSALAGLAARWDTINPTEDDAVLQAKRLAAQSRSPDKDTIAAMDASELKKLIEKNESK